MDPEKYTLDSTERKLIEQITLAIAVDEGHVTDVFHNLLLWVCWIGEKWRTGHSGQLPFFYLYYSMVLHVGTAACSLLDMKKVSNAGTLDFVEVNRCFVESCTRAFSAIDIIGQVARAADQPGANDLGFMPEWEEFGIQGVAFLRSLKGENAMPKLSFSGREFNFAAMADLLRNRQMHRAFIYVVPMGNDRESRKWFVLTPELSVRALDEVRMFVNILREEARNSGQPMPKDPWAQVLRDEPECKKYFFPNDGSTPLYEPMEATALLSTVVSYAIETMSKFSSPTK